MTATRGVMERAFAEAVKTAPVRPEDGATVALGRRLAQTIDVLRGEDDEPAASFTRAAEYRQVLAQLGMTVAARAVKAAPAEAEKPKSALQKQRDELAERRARQASS